MEKYHVHTTLSPKHRELLDKYKEKYVTHQRVIEQALDCLEKSSINTLPLSEQDKLRIKLTGDLGILCLTQKETLKLLLETADINRFMALAAAQKPAESVVEYYNQKPLNECSLKEVMDGLVAVGKLANWFEEVSYVDKGDHYSMKIYHNMGINNSKIFQIFFESMFKTYGARSRIDISERSLFIKAYKKP
jgi:hypothetical protein